MDVLFAGIDVSTQGSKLVIIDWTNKSVLYVDSIQYDRDLPFYGTMNGIIPNENKGVSESDPLMWIAAVELLLERANKNSIPLKNVKAISVSGQQHGLVALDKNGELSRPTSKLWNDFSTQEECDLLTQKVGGEDQMIAEIGNTQRTGYTASKIYNMFRHEKDAYDKTEIFLLVHNYINWYLTGGVAVMEPGDTSGTALWNPIKQTWSNNVISSISEDLKSKLPDVKPATQFIGIISAAIAKRFGFSLECKIGAGSGDNMYGAVGTGNIKPGIVTVSLGTSGTAYTFMKKPYVDQDGEIACFCDSTGHSLPLLCILFLILNLMN
jgi:xylulokinase